MTQTKEQKQAERNRWRKLGFRFVTVRVHTEDWALLRRLIARWNSRRQS